MERSGLIGKIGRDWIFVRVHDAVRGAGRQQLTVM
jgi:hypothetical protein